MNLKIKLKYLAIYHFLSSMILAAFQGNEIFSSAWYNFRIFKFGNCILEEPLYINCE